METRYIDIDTDLPVLAVTSKGQKINKNVAVTLANVNCLTWLEECHGFHRMFEPIESELNFKIQEFYDNLSLEDAENLLADYLALDEKIIEIREG